MAVSNWGDLKTVCKLMYETFKLPVFCLNEKGELVFQYTASYVHNPFHPSKQELLNQLFDPENPHEFPVLKTTNYMENFFLIYLQKNHRLRGSIIVGPSIFFKPSEEIMKGFTNDLKIVKEKDDLIHYYQSLPVMSRLTFAHASILFYYMIYHKELDITTVLQENKKIEEKTDGIKDADLTVSEKLQDFAFHQDPFMEKKLFQFVKEGRKDALAQQLTLLPKNGVLGILAKKSHIRSQKNLAIASITLATRSAMDGGLHSEIAYTTSDLYIQKLEELTKTKQVNTLLKEALFYFADRVQNSKKQQYSSAITTCRSYIFKHLYDEITLSQLAEIVAMSPKYLSALFKKEVGISLSTYIQGLKIEEAKNLIMFSNYSLTEIYTLLNYYDQSYFTKVFKQYTGITPKQFQQKHALISTEIN